MEINIGYLMTVLQIIKSNGFVDILLHQVDKSSVLYIDQLVLVHTKNLHNPHRHSEHKTIRH